MLCVLRDDERRNRGSDGQVGTEPHINWVSTRGGYYVGIGDGRCRADGFGNGNHSLGVGMRYENVFLIAVFMGVIAIVGTCI